MDASNSERIKSGRMAVRLLADPQVRESLRRASVPFDAPVVVCEWETSMGEVMCMIERGCAAASAQVEHVVIAFRRQDEMFTIIASSSDVQVLGDYISASEIHAASPIGHVYEALQPHKKWNLDFANTAPTEPAVVSLAGFNFELV